MRCGHKVAEADNSPYYHEIYNLLKYGDAAFYGGDDFTYYIPRKSSLHKFIPKSEY
jgi:hypothetical protein